MQSAQFQDPDATSGTFVVTKSTLLNELRAGEISRDIDGIITPLNRLSKGCFQTKRNWPQCRLIAVK